MGQNKVLRIAVTCKCGNEFLVREKRLAAGRGTYCSQECKYKYRERPTGLKYNIVAENKSWFKKGHNLNKGKGLGIRRSPNSEFKPGERRSIATEFKPGTIPIHYKGESVGYYALHAWIKRHKGRACVCRKCGSSKNIQWANISHEYKRNLFDYIELCAKCHRSYDTMALGVATRKYNLQSCRKK